MRPPKKFPHSLLRSTAPTLKPSPFFPPSNRPFPGWEIVRDCGAGGNGKADVDAQTAVDAAAVIARRMDVRLLADNTAGKYSIEGFRHAQADLFECCFGGLTVTGAKNFVP